MPRAGPPDRNNYYYKHHQYDLRTQERADPPESYIRGINALAIVISFSIRALLPLLSSDFIIIPLVARSRTRTPELVLLVLSTAVSIRVVKGVL